MNNVIVTTVNTKGQLVIPKKIRDALKITPQVNLGISLRDQGIVIQPIERISPKGSQRDRLLEVLRLTQGAWGPATKEEIEREKKQRALELRASKKRKNAW